MQCVLVFLFAALLQLLTELVYSFLNWSEMFSCIVVLCQSLHTPNLALVLGIWCYS